jgi:uncharacterized protein (PEP-CTERM system associated)
VPVTPEHAPVAQLPPAKPGAPQAIPPSFFLKINAELSETYTTNALGLTDAAKAVDDFDTRGSVHVALHEAVERFTADVDYRFSADYFARTSSSIQISNNLAGLADAVIFPEYVTFDTSFFAAPVFVSPLGAITSGGRPLPKGANSNIRDTYGYSAAPKLTFRLGDFASSTLTPSYSSVYFVRPAGASNVVPIGGTPPPHSSTFSVVEQLISGDDFYRLHWSAVGTYTQTSHSALGLKESSGVAEIDYAVTRELYLLSNVGYQAYNAAVPLSKNLSGLVALGGVKWVYGTSEASVRAGEQFNSASYLGEAHIEVSPSLTVAANLDDSISTPANQLLGNLSNLAATSSGSLYDTSDLLSQNNPASLGSFDPVSGGDFGFDNTISRYRAVRVSVLYDYLNTHFIFVAFGTRRNILSAVPAGESARQTNAGASLIGSRDLGPKLTVDLRLEYRNEQIFIAGHDNAINVGADAAYHLTPDVDLYFRADYVRRLSSATLTAALPPAGSLSDTSFTIGVRKAF